MKKKKVYKKRAVKSSDQVLCTTSSRKQVTLLNDCAYDNHQGDNSVSSCEANHQGEVALPFHQSSASTSTTATHSTMPKTVHTAANDSFVEPVTKEKLRYLRYFRLITHRKRNGRFKLYKMAQDKFHFLI